MRTYTVEEVLNQKDFLLVDVRSPEEYREDTIPTAINMPILDNEERKEIGYLYKQVDPFVAKRKGLEIATKKLTNFYDFVLEKQKEYKQIIFFCYRGGTRSMSVAQNLSMLGLKAGYLKGGYKNYRTFVLKELPLLVQDIKLIGLQGLTGIGKTKILIDLEEKNIPILDLEYYAQNSGSAFGNIVYSENGYPSQKKFESLLYYALLKQKSKYYFVECESKRIGRVMQPEYFYDKLQEASRILLSTSIENRVSNVLIDYVKPNETENKAMILKAINSLNKRLGKDKTEKLCKCIETDNYEEVIATLMIDYYDPLYIHKIEEDRPFIAEIEFDEISEATNQLIEIMNKILKEEE